MPGFRRSSHILTCLSSKVANSFCTTIKYLNGFKYAIGQTVTRIIYGTAQLQGKTCMSSTRVLLVSFSRVNLQVCLSYLQV